MQARYFADLHFMLLFICDDVNIVIVGSWRNTNTIGFEWQTKPRGSLSNG